MNWRITKMGKVKMKSRILEFIERLKVILATISVLIGVIVQSSAFLVVFIIVIPVFIFSRDSLSVAIKAIVKSGIAKMEG